MRLLIPLRLFVLLFFLFRLHWSRLLAAVAVQTAFPQEEKCVGAANARSAEQFATAERLIAARLRPAVRLHCGRTIRFRPASVPHDWAQDGYSVVPSVDGWARADRSAVLLADDSIRAVAGSARLGSGRLIGWADGGRLGSGRSFGCAVGRTIRFRSVRVRPIIRRWLVGARGSVLWMRGRCTGRWLNGGAFHWSAVRCPCWLRMHNGAVTETLLAWE